jgi:hypothetical protein
MQNGHLKMATDKRFLHLRHFFFINTTNRNYRIHSKIILRFNYSIVHDFFRILNVEVNFKLNQLSFLHLKLWSRDSCYVGTHLRDLRMAHDGGYGFKKCPVASS